MGDTLRVNEIFGPTIQGEGPAAGRRAVFLRLMGCNLSCSWCDTPWTWDADRFDLHAETQLLTAEQIVSAIDDLPGMLVITGGEPLLLQGQPAFRQLLAHSARHREVHVETNGTIAPAADIEAWVSLFVVSPKLGNAGTHRGRQDPTMHGRWVKVIRHGKAVLKIVCRDAADVDHAVKLALDHRVPLDRLWVMPEGATRDELDVRWPTIASAAVARNCNATHRLHVLAWNDERGR